MWLNPFFILILPFAFVASTGCQKPELHSSIEAVGSGDISITCDEGNGAIFRLLPKESRQVRFALFNHTDRNLHVESIESSCGCAYPMVENITLLPGVHTNMFVTLVAEKVGVLDHQIRLELSNGTVNEYFVDFQSVVATPIVTKPEQLDLRLPSGIHRLDFEIQSASDDSFDLLLIDCKCEDLDFELINESQKSVTFSLKVEVDPVRVIDTFITILVESDLGVYTHEVPVKIGSQDDFVVFADDLLLEK